MNKVKIRKAESTDIEEMYRIDLDGWYQNFLDEERGVTEEALQKNYGKIYGDANKIREFSEIIINDQHVCFVAESEGRVIGWVNLENLYTPDVSWLNIYVDKNWQEKGIGRLLMEAMIEKYSHIEMHVATPKKANLKGFYEKFGFVEYLVEGRIEGPGRLYNIQMKRQSSATLLK